MLRKIASSTWCAPEKAPMLPVVAFRAASSYSNGTGISSKLGKLVAGFCNSLSYFLGYQKLLHDAVIVCYDLWAFEKFVSMLNPKKY